MDDIRIKTIIRKMSIKQRSDGRYEGRITLDSGKRKSFYGDTKVSVKEKARLYLSSVEQGYVESGKITLDEYAIYWLEKYKYRHIEDSSYNRLRSHYLNVIAPVLGKCMIGEITSKHIQKLIDDRANPPINSGIKPLSYSGLKRTMQFLRPCLDMAMKEGVITHENPCNNVMLPKEQTLKKETKKQFSFSDQEIDKFKEAALRKYKSTGEYASRDGIVLLIILSLGLRVGEALALEWSDLQEEDGKSVLKITKTVQCNLKNYHDSSKPKRYDKVKNSAKTKSGVRTLPVNESTLEYFQMLREYDLRHGISSPYIVCTSAGTRNNQRNLQRSMDRILAHSDMSFPEKPSLHTLRHTFGSTLLRRSVNIEVVSSLLGHSSASFTYKTYVHVINEEKAKAMDLVKIC